MRTIVHRDCANTKHMLCTKWIQLDSLSFPVIDVLSNQTVFDVSFVAR